MNITNKLLKEKGFEERRLGDGKYQYTCGKLCLEFQGLGKGRFLFYYMFDRNYLSKEIKTEEELNFLMTFINN